MFYARLILRRTSRLRGKFLGVRESTGSSWKGVRFVLTFIHRRFGFLIRHLLAYSLRRPAKVAARGGTDSTPSHLALRISGGLGDYVVAALYVRDLLAQIRPATFDIFCNDSDRAEWIFRDLAGFGGSYTEFLFGELKDDYDVALQIGHVLSMHNKPLRLRKLRHDNHALFRVVDNVLRFKPLIAPLMRDDPTFDNFVARRIVYMNFNRANFLQHMAGIALGDGRLPLRTDPQLVDRLRLRRRGFITVHNGFDPAVVTVNSRSTKNYPHFAEVVRLIKAAHPELAMVQLGTRNSQPIDGVDHNLIGQTDLPQAAAILQHAAWHVDVESGLVHLAHCLGTRSTVVFGPTPADYFGYEDNDNISPAACGGCWWINETWMSHCPRGFATPICTNQPPMTIAHSVLDAIRRKRPEPLARVALIR